jgi:hypothetical protein
MWSLDHIGCWGTPLKGSGAAPAGSHPFTQDIALELRSGMKSGGFIIVRDFSIAVSCKLESI